MLTPLIRFKFETKEKMHYQLTDNLRIIINDPTVFPQWNNMHIGGDRSIELFPGISAMSFNYNPLLLGFFPYVEDYPDAATKVLDYLLKGFALFKTTHDTKFKLGPRIVQTLNSVPQILMLNVRGSDDFQEFTGKSYELTLKELDEFKEFYIKLKNLLERLDNRKLLESLEFYIKATRTENSVDKFVFLSISFEFLFSKEDDELSYRFSNRASLLLGTNSAERKKISQLIKNVVYRQRSKIMHGSSVTPPENDVTMYFFELMRVSLLRFISLIYSEHNDPLEELDSFLLTQDTTLYEKFLKDAESIFSEISKMRFQSIRKKIQ